MKQFQGMSHFLMHELFDAIRDTIACGDLAGHLRAFRRVAAGQVTPFHAAGIPTPRHSSGEGGAAASGAAVLRPRGNPRPPFSLCSTPAGDAPGAAGGDPACLSATPICTIFPSGQVETY